MISIKVYFNNQEVGIVTQDSHDHNYYVFRYTDEFINSGIELCPLLMPLRKTNYIFKNLSISSFKGLPPLLADSLPDSYGSELLFYWQKIHNKASLNPLEVLSYIGKRGMGALEFVPSNDELEIDENELIEIDSLSNVANQILNEREKVVFDISNIKLTQLISVGSSIGGARAKAIVAINEDGNIKSGQISGLKGYEYAIIKFDGLLADLSEEKDVTYYTRIEYAYYLMAKACGINMSECALLEIKNKYHFKTKKFDRDENGNKIHMLSLAGLAGFDYLKAGEYSYEDVALIIHRLNGGMDEIFQLYKRMVFNVICKNHDDHIKNISFIMDKDGQYHLSPAYDITYSYNPNGEWTRFHQMRINDKVDNITMEDLLVVARKMSISPYKATKMINEVKGTAKEFKSFAKEAKLPDQVVEEIFKQFTLLE